MNKQLFVNNIISYITIIGFLFLNSISLYSQDFINARNFDKKISNDIVVIEFWAEWNDKNKFEDLGRLSECQKYRVDINENESLKDKYDIMALPTIIVFNDGKQEKRFNANIAFELNATKKDIQNIIDDLILQKFR
jgi:thiol-disulfide isomerase/thioredoxin|tara:strand:- start:1290 stop:1697 length:408 start_codon:yes stop_codon:yes gene_type:complete